jgi:hypothetical protein
MYAIYPPLSLQKDGRILPYERFWQVEVTGGARSLAGIDC